MKQFFLIILFFCNLSAFSQQYWLSVSSPVNKTLAKSHFIDTIFGWAAGDSGTIIHTSNSGLNWAQQTSGINYFAIDDIFFVNRNFGWALANDFFYAGTIMLKTTNGGQNWTNYRYPDTSLVFNVVYFLDSLNGFLSGFSGKIFKTTNAGANWFNCYIDTSYCPLLFLMPKNKFYFVNASTGFACGGQIDIQGMIWRTTNGGAIWKTYCVASEPLYDIKVISNNKVISNGGDYEYGLNTVHSSDGGNTWFFELNNFFGLGLSLAYRTPAEVWVPLSFAQTFAVNTDSGNYGTTWNEIETPHNRIIKSTVFMSPTFGWSFGSEGSIYKYNTAIIGFNNNSQYIPEVFEMHQNYPNPFNPTTTIGYTLNRGGMVKVEIFNLMGELINILFIGYQPAGYHNIQWNAVNAASGIYFCKVTFGSKQLSIKMLMIK